MPVPRRLLAFAAVLGPGVLAGLSDDDPPGITTYSILGAEEGYRLLWAILLSTLILILFHDLGSRMGVVTGQGLTGLVRQRYGLRVGLAALVALLVANVGTTAAEFAGIAVCAGLLAASILPLSTAYSVGETFGHESALNDRVRDAPLFYGTYAAVVIVAGGAVLVPTIPLVDILFLTQALNAILLLPLLPLVYGISRDADLMGEYATGPREALVTLAAIGVVALAVGTLAVVSLLG